VLRAAKAVATTVQRRTHYAQRHAITKARGKHKNYPEFMLWGTGID